MHMLFSYSEQSAALYDTNWAVLYDSKWAVLYDIAMTQTCRTKTAKEV